jgi:hypothetical protein
MKNFSIIDIPLLSKCILILTVVLFVSSLILRILGIYKKITTLSTITLGLFSFFTICLIKKTKSELFISTLLVGDCTYLLSLFFMIGRTLMKSIHKKHIKIMEENKNEQIYRT